MNQSTDHNHQSTMLSSGGLQTIKSVTARVLWSGTACDHCCSWIADCVIVGYYSKPEIHAPKCFNLTFALS